MIKQKHIQAALHIFFNVFFTAAVLMAVKENFNDKGSKLIYVFIAAVYLIFTILINELIKKIFK